MSLGKNIRRLRRDKGWTQAKLSEQTGIRIGHISKLEQDDGDSKLYKLMNAFSWPPDSLLMDLNRVTTGAVLKQTLERATALPDAEKRAIIEVVDKYCIACGFLQQFVPGNKLPLGFGCIPTIRLVS